MMQPILLSTPTAPQVSDNLADSSTKQSPIDDALSSEYQGAGAFSVLFGAAVDGGVTDNAGKDHNRVSEEALMKYTVSLPDTADSEADIDGAILPEQAALLATASPADQLDKVVVDEEKSGSKDPAVGVSVVNSEAVAFPSDFKESAADADNDSAAILAQIEEAQKAGTQLVSPSKREQAAGDNPELVGQLKNEATAVASVGSKVGELAPANSEVKNKSIKSSAPPSVNRAAFAPLTSEQAQAVNTAPPVAEKEQPLQADSLTVEQANSVKTTQAGMLARAKESEQSTVKAEFLAAGSGKTNETNSFTAGEDQPLKAVPSDALAAAKGKAQAAVKGDTLTVEDDKALTTGKTAIQLAEKVNRQSVVRGDALTVEDGKTQIADKAELLAAQKSSVQATAKIGTLTVEEDKSLQDIKSAPLAVEGEKPLKTAQGQTLNLDIAVQTAEKQSEPLFTNNGETEKNIVIDAVDNNSLRSTEINSATLNKPLNQNMHTAASTQLQQPLDIQSKHAAALLGERMLMMINEGKQEVHMRLDPAELGSMHVKLQMHQDQLHLSIQTDVGQSRDIIEQNLPKLREQLAQQGLSLGETHVEQQEQGRQQSADQQGEHGVGNIAVASAADSSVPITDNDMMLTTLNPAHSAQGIDYYA